MAYGHAERNLAAIRRLEAETEELLSSLPQSGSGQPRWLQQTAKANSQQAGAPIIIDDRLWGAAVALNFASDDLPAAAVERIANFADLTTTAMSNAETRSELIASRARAVAAADHSSSAYGAAHCG
jgi:hypothetical protein